MHFDKLGPRGLVRAGTRAPYAIRETMQSDSMQYNKFDCRYVLKETQLGRIGEVLTRPRRQRPGQALLPACKVNKSAKCAVSIMSIANTHYTTKVREKRNVNVLPFLWENPTTDVCRVIKLVRVLNRESPYTNNVFFTPAAADTFQCSWFISPSRSASLSRPVAAKSYPARDAYRAFGAPYSSS